MTCALKSANPSQDFTKGLNSWRLNNFQHDTESQWQKFSLLTLAWAKKTLNSKRKGVDLHLLKRALQSTHFQFWEECFQNVLCGYTSILGDELAEKVYEKIREIERRGRYVEERKQ